mmetsp:Transcript_49202/g.151917  ORF Transcript_49202/g.151917 Transcript_49202/m.151917 type:complete len:296 (+) Transcript_49202:2583-3470(+)
MLSTGVGCQHDNWMPSARRHSASRHVHVANARERNCDQSADSPLRQLDKSVSQSDVVDTSRSVRGARCTGFSCRIFCPRFGASIVAGDRESQCVQLLWRRTNNQTRDEFAYPHRHSRRGSGQCNALRRRSFGHQVLRNGSRTRRDNDCHVPLPRAAALHVVPGCRPVRADYSDVDHGCGCTVHSVAQYRSGAWRDRLDSSSLGDRPASRFRGFPRFKFRASTIPSIVPLRSARRASNCFVFPSATFGGYRRGSSGRQRGILPQSTVRKSQSRSVRTIRTYRCHGAHASPRSVSKG